MSRIDRISSASLARRTVRTETNRVEPVEAGYAAKLPVPVGPAVTVARSLGPNLRGGDSEFTAQMFGQDGQRRGLRAGEPYIDAARQAYNRVEYSGRYDRRTPAGVVARAKI